MSLSKVGQHLFETAESIRGPMNPLVWQSIAAFYKSQQNRGFSGPVAEIGVHHGKFFISLLMLVPDDEQATSYAFDLFDLQEYNVDKSGKGDLDILTENIAASGLSLSKVKIVKCDSLELSQISYLSVLQDCPKFSFFSVDGGHTIEHTISDLKIAMKLTSPKGIIMLDDYYNPNWPGVQEGFVKLFLLENPAFVPILYSANKLFLCHFSLHDAYFVEIVPYLRKTFPDGRAKVVQRMGYRGISFQPNGSTLDPREWLAD